MYPNEDDPSDTRTNPFGLMNAIDESRDGSMSVSSHGSNEGQDLNPRDEHHCRANEAGLYIAEPLMNSAAGSGNINELAV